MTRRHPARATFSCTLRLHPRRRWLVHLFQRLQQRLNLHQARVRDALAAKGLRFRTRLTLSWNSSALEQIKELSGRAAALYCRVSARKTDLLWRHLPSAFHNTRYKTWRAFAADVLLHCRAIPTLLAPSTLQNSYLDTTLRLRLGASPLRSGCARISPRALPLPYLSRLRGALSRP